MKQLNITATFTCVIVATSVSISAQPKPKVTLKKADKKISAYVGDELFTEYHFAGFKKPLLYPLHINKSISLTRNYPIKKVAGEQPDHLHHKSVWFSHQFNNIMFWGEKGTVKHKKFLAFKPEAKNPTFTALSSWIHDGKRMFQDQTTVTFHAAENYRAIDFEVKLIATDGDVLINDTKEGSFAVRVHPNLRHKPDKKHGIPGGATMVNSAGQTGPKIWGQPAAWVDYSGKIDGKVYGIAIFDHPKNLRHPTTWHARDYGLLAANPFGLHYFQKKEKGAGAYKIKANDSLTLRYRLIVHQGDHKTARIAEMYSEFEKAAKNQTD